MKFIPFALGTLILLSSAPFIAPISLAQNSGKTMVVSPDDRRFASQPFSNALLQQIPIGDKACRAYQGKPYCSYRRRYPFKDAVLTNEGNVPSDSTLILTPTTPVMMNQAIAYAKILSGSRINYGSSPARSGNKITYRGCPFPDGGFLCATDLTVGSDGKVTTIKFAAGSP